MGHRYTRIRVSNIERSKAVEAVADSGAAVTAISEKAARGAGRIHLGNSEKWHCSY